MTDASRTGIITSAITCTLDTAGLPQLAQTFDLYGNGYAKSGSATTTLGFTGEMSDSSGFVFLRARYYNPSAGRFFQTDPSRQEMNPFAYSVRHEILKGYGLAKSMSVNLWLLKRLAGPSNLTGTHSGL